MLKVYSCSPTPATKGQVGHILSKDVQLISMFIQQKIKTHVVIIPVANKWLHQQKGLSWQNAEKHLSLKQPNS